MKIDVTTLETPELLQLIAAASSELQKRVAAGAAVIERRPAAEPAVIVINEPCKSDKDLVQRILTLRRQKGFVLSGERREYKSIVAKYPDWAKSKRLPDDVSGSAYNKWGRLHGS